MQEVIYNDVTDNIPIKKVNLRRKDTIFAVTYAVIILLLLGVTSIFASFDGESNKLTEALKNAGTYFAIFSAVNLPMIVSGILAIITNGKTSRFYKGFTVVLAIFGIIIASGMFLGIGILLSFSGGFIWAMVLSYILYFLIMLAAFIIPLFKKKRPEDEGVSPQKYNLKMLLLFGITMLSFIVIEILATLLILDNGESTQLIPDSLLWLSLLHLPGMLFGTLAFLLKNGWATFFAVINQILSIGCIILTAPVLLVVILGFFFIPPISVIILAIWLNFVEINLFLFLFAFRRKKNCKRRKGRGFA